MANHSETRGMRFCLFVCSDQGSIKGANSENLRLTFVYVWFGLHLYRLLLKL